MISKKYNVVVILVMAISMANFLSAQLDEVSGEVKSGSWVKLEKRYGPGSAMTPGLKKAVEGYGAFRKKYVLGDVSVMKNLYKYGQHPELMVVACADSRVDPALITQSDPGDLFVVRNVANLVPPYELGGAYHGTSAALEYAVKHLKVKHLIILGHSECGGVKASLDAATFKSDFIGDWVSLIKKDDLTPRDSYSYAQLGLLQSRDNCLTFPWIKERVENGELTIHLWFLDIKQGRLYTYVD